jgi:Na+/melibiose symporter-like transporter
MTTIDENDSTAADEVARLMKAETKNGRVTPRYSDQMTTKAADLRMQADSIWRNQQVHDPRGGLRTVQVASGLHDALQTKISEEINQGQAQHERLNKFARTFAKIAVFLDFLVLGYFMTSVFNVDLAHPVSVAGFIALVFAAIATGVTYSWFSVTGKLLRNIKSNRNRISRKDLNGATIFMLIGSFIMSVVLGVLMRFRVHGEVFDALGNSQLANLYGAVFAVIIFFLAWIIICVDAFDGSKQTEHVDELGKNIRKPMKKRQALLDEADRIDHLVAEQVRIADRQS